jgi:hypothetical protein
MISEERVSLMFVAKLNHGMRETAPLWVVRDADNPFKWDAHPSADTQRIADQNQDELVRHAVVPIVEHLRKMVDADLYPNRGDIDNLSVKHPYSAGKSIPRKEMRAALTLAMVEKRVKEVDIPDQSARRGSKQTYLVPIDQIEPKMDL